MDEEQFKAELEKELSPERIKQLKQSYDYFIKSGLSQAETKAAMNLTSLEVSLIRSLWNNKSNNVIPNLIGDLI